MICLEEKLHGCYELFWFGLVPLFNGTSVFMGYLIPMLFLQNSSDTISPMSGGRVRRFIPFPGVLVRKSKTLTITLWRLLFLTSLESSTLQNSGCTTTYLTSHKLSKQGEQDTTRNTQIYYLPNPSARAGYDTRSIFKRSLTGLNSEFSFS